MNWWQTLITVIIAVLGSNVIVEIIRNRSAKEAEQTKRKQELEDRAMAKNDKTLTLEERFDEFEKSQKSENREIRQRLSGVENALGLLNEEMSSDKYIAMRKEALAYIRQGEVDAEDRATLRERYARYKKISGKNDLDKIMEELDRLDLKHNKEDK